MENQKIKWISTAPDSLWEERMPQTASGTAELELDGNRYQDIEGFGGCFNELGWIALSGLDKAERERIFDALFNQETGCRFNFCRLPIGANDYAAEWYSLNETSGDYEMENFTIERDRSYLIPYIKTALKYKPDMKLFASPWSPPTWMKFPKVYNYGTLIWEDRNLKAYALYFKKFVEAYEAEGIRIHQIHVQNEPFADQKFPSCLWTGEQTRDFIRDYMGPQFEKSGIKTEIWLGTINDGDYNNFANIVLSDPQARKYISGVGYQWAGKDAIRRTWESWPELRLMQTENECGDGRNTWEYAHYVFTLFRHYLSSGANAYIYWNMVLEPGGRSTWGWKQNSLITVDKETGKVTYNPEFYVMKHFSRFVDKGAVRVGVKGRWTGNSIAFENPDGSIVFVVENPFHDDHSIRIKHGSDVYEYNMKPYSINTIVVGM